MTQSIIFRRKALVSVFAVFAAFSTGASAQFVGQGAPAATPETVFSTPPSKVESAALGTEMQVSTVAAILKNPVDDLPVLVRGRLLRKLRKEHYEFSDGTGTIRVEIDNKVFVNQPVTEKTLVELYGEIEKDFMESPEIEVERMSVIPAK